MTSSDERPRGNPGLTLAADAGLGASQPRGGTINQEDSRSAVPNVLAPGTALWKAVFPWTGAGGGEDGFGKIQAHHIYRALYFYCYHVSSPPTIRQ